MLFGGPSVRESIGARGWVADAQMHDRTEAGLRGAGDEAFDARFAEGMEMPAEQLFQLAISS